MGKKTEYYPYNDIKTHCFHIVFDLDGNENICQSEEDWCEEIFDEIPNFALGDEKAREISKASPRKATKQGMKLLYEVKEIREANDGYLALDSSVEDKYLKRGEFGELILYYLLKKKLNKPQLISKIYFKDSYNAVVHGFDAVHYDKESNELWIGESKFYKDKNAALRELADDLDKHFNSKFFKQEFTIISNRFEDLGIQNDEIKNLIAPDSKVLSKLVKINACFFALFDDEILKSFSYEKGTDKPSQDFLDRLKDSVEKARTNFDDKTKGFLHKENLKIHLFLFPVESKYKLVKKMHEKLKKEQS
ncbi:hypothetical protein Hs30E_12800 [Lactococcus hodotermopsidis]|uniref:Anti-bacteriophage protein A/HamA C-terminal domain-containing protein n=1 Tax=Pseudolactococcus hodotermopsidis TaxID=2709157 RepID=A0A6A0BBA1_9LACT|nr:DUF1837 domain-containing protein [Lactococcus hodotermopsidis]GFH42729.1 hypothetical protein Hs30E_12800 [Lactococcus hodotermopsidis]